MDSITLRSVIVSALIAVIPAALALWGSYDLHGRGEIPEKNLELVQWGASNVMDDLKQLEGKVSLRINGQPLPNLFIGSAKLTNMGKAPIVPSDFVEVLSVNTEMPWKLLAVENENWPRAVPLRWQKINDGRFEANRTLLNPGDTIAVKIYITNNQLSDLSAPITLMDMKRVRWETRVVNLQKIDERPSSEMLDKLAKRRGIFYVELTGWSLLFTVVAALILQFSYLYLLRKARLVTGLDARSLLLVLASSGLGFAIAEVLATYIFGNSMTDIAGVSTWANAPWLVLNVVVVAVLMLVARYRGGRNQPRTSQ